MSQTIKSICNFLDNLDENSLEKINILENFKHFICYKKTFIKVNQILVMECFTNSKYKIFYSMKQNILLI